LTCDYYLKSFQPWPFPTLAVLRRFGRKRCHGSVIHLITCYLQRAAESAYGVPASVTMTTENW